MKQSLAYRMMIWAGLAVLLIWSLGPVYWTFASALTPTEDFSARPIHFFPQNITFDHFAARPCSSWWWRRLRSRPMPC